MKVSDLAIIRQRDMGRELHRQTLPGADRARLGITTSVSRIVAIKFFLAREYRRGGQSVVCLRNNGGAVTLWPAEAAVSITRTRAWPMAARLTPRAIRSQLRSSLSKPQWTLAAGHAPLGPGSVLPAWWQARSRRRREIMPRSDSTRGGTVFFKLTPRHSGFKRDATGGYVPLAVNLNGSGIERS